jgi:hypothetical protein
MFGTPSCVIPYSDVGKHCSGKADCQGLCINEEGSDAAWVAGEYPKPGDVLSGTCQANDALFGCYAEIEGGTVREAICVD